MTEQLTLYDAQVIGAPHNGTSTSIAAAVAAGPKVSPQKRRILDVMGNAFDGKGFVHMGGWSQDELSFWLELPRSTICARFNELEREGLIKKTDATRPTRYGRQAAVYVLASSASESETGTPRRQAS